MQHNKLQATERDLLAAPGHVPHLVGNQAANGVEVLLGVAAVQDDFESFCHALDGCVAADAPGEIGQGEDVAFVLRDVELILDLANDLLEHVFDSDEPGHAAKLVDHDGQVIAVATKFAQQVIEPFALRHKNGRPQQGADVQCGRTLQLEQVFGQQDADDVVALALVHRKPRMRGLNDQVQQGVRGCIDVEQIHARCGHHDIARGHIGHAQHALEHDARIGANDVVVLGVGQGFDEFFGGVGPRMDELGHFLQEAALVFPFGQTPWVRGVRVRHCLGVQDVR